jgi:hypothetical protein
MNRRAIFRLLGALTEGSRACFYIYKPADHTRPAGVVRRVQQCWLNAVSLPGRWRDA